jgi:predicted anti-sigma-YlaC factor YlaD
MNHKPFQETMHAVLDGDSATGPGQALTPAARLELEAHLAECGECQATWTTLSEVQRLLRAEPVVAPRPGFNGRFQARLAQRRSRPRLLWGGVALGLGAVSAAALVVPVGLGLLVAAVRAAQEPTTSLALLSSFSAVASFADTILGALYIALRALLETAAASPFGWAASLLSRVLAAVWLYVMRHLPQKGTMR